MPWCRFFLNYFNITDKCSVYYKEHDSFLFMKKMHIKIKCQEKLVFNHIYANRPSYVPRCRNLGIIPLKKMKMNQTFEHNFFLNLHIYTHVWENPRYLMKNIHGFHIYFKMSSFYLVLCLL